MKKILVFAGSNSSTSINKKLVTYAASLLDNVKSHILDLNDFEMPIYSSDREKNNGYPDEAMLLMATSPGARGGASVLEMAISRFPRHNANIIETFSLPSFNDNFESGKIINAELNDKLKQKVEQFEKNL